MKQFLMIGVVLAGSLMANNSPAGVEPVYGLRMLFSAEDSTDQRSEEIYSNFMVVTGWGYPHGSDPIFDGLEMVGTGLLTTIQFTIANFGLETLTGGTCDVLLYEMEGDLVPPENLISSFSLDLGELSIPSYYFSTHFVDVEYLGIDLSPYNNIFAGIAFTSAVGVGLEYVGQANFDPPTLGSSEDWYYHGGLEEFQTFGGGQVANFGWKICRTDTVLGIQSPGQYPMLQIEPNPASSYTEVSIELPMETHVLLEVRDVAGRLVRELTDGVIPAGQHSISWEGCNQDGKPVAAGVYLIRMALDDMQFSRRVSIIR